MTKSQGKVASSPGGRESWIDLAKGAAILLVVLFHSEVLLAAHGLTGAGWAAATTALGALRMPTFFLVSGLFAQKSLTVQSSVFRARKVWPFLWVYALWSMAYILMSGGIGLVSRDRALLLDAAEWAAATLTLSSGLWYLVALPVFFFVTRLLCHVPVRAQVIGAGIVSFTFSCGLVHTGQWGPDHMASNFVYFLIGCYFSGVIRSTVVRVGWMTAASLGLAWIGLFVLFYATHWQDLGYAILPLLAVPFALASASLLARQTWAVPLIWLGRNTLPVYIMHFAPVSLIVLAVRRTHLVTAGSGLAAALPVFVAMAAVGITLGIRWLLMRWAPWSFALPTGSAGRRQVVPDTRSDRPLTRPPALDG